MIKMHSLRSTSGTRRAYFLCKLLSLAVGLAVFSLGGCAVGPDYKRPPTHPPASFRGDSQASIATNSLADLAWWELFQDPHLQSLVRTALTNNYDLRIAAARVEQARAAARQTRAEFFPQVNYDAGIGRGKNVGAGGAPVPNSGAGTLYYADLSAQWEIDLWGRVRRLNESARAQFFASQEARRDVMTSLTAQLAQSYFQLLALDRQLEIALESTNSFGQSLAIFTKRLKGGVASRLETSAAEALLASALATVPEIERQIAAQENQINLLIGRNPADVYRVHARFADQHLPELPPGLPASLLERRPDIREAEQQLRAANAQVGVAEADFFPQLNLMGLLGEANPKLAALTSGSSLAWSAGATLSGPLFHGGQIKARYAQALAARDQRVLQYQAAVLNALKECSDALSAREKLAEAHDAQVRAVQAHEVAAKIAFARYRSGKSSYYEVLQQQQQLFPAENTLVQTELNRLIAIVQLYRALGGGWQPEQ